MIIFLIGGILLFMIGASIAYLYGFRPIIAALMTPATVLEKFLALLKGWMT